MKDNTEYFVTYYAESLVMINTFSGNIVNSTSKLPLVYDIISVQNVTHGFLIFSTVDKLYKLDINNFSDYLIIISNQYDPYLGLHNMVIDMQGNIYGMYWVDGTSDNVPAVLINCDVYRKDSTGMILGVFFSVVIIIVLSVIVGFCIYRRRREADKYVTIG